jgi:hypothetical protein
MIAGHAARKCMFATALTLPMLLYFSSIARNACAGIVASSGVSLLGGPPPGNVLPGTQQPTLLPLFFSEVIGGQVSSPGGLPVDHDGSDLAPTLVQSTSVVDAALVAGVIPANTKFDSYLFHFDPGNSTFPSDANFYVDASIEFSTKILGVQLLSGADLQLDKPAGTDYVGTLEFGDAEVSANGGPAAAYYPSTASFRGLEEDSIAIDLASHRISLAGKAFGTEIDQLRVIVAVVPEPATFLILGAGVALLSALRRRPRYTDAGNSERRFLARQS